MKKLILFITALLFLTVAVHSQVKIGSKAEPVKGAVLDLNKDTDPKGGLLLPNVNITDTAKISADFTEITLRNADNANQLAGMIVWNINTTTGTGVYVWDGTKWLKLKITN